MSRLARLQVPKEQKEDEMLIIGKMWEVVRMLDYMSVIYGAQTPISRQKREDGVFDLKKIKKRHTA